MDDWEKFNVTSLPQKENFNIKHERYLIMEDVTDADYKHAKKDFKIKHLDEYGDLYVQSDTLLLAGVFNTF